MLKRDTPGFTSIDINYLIRTVERIVYGDAMLHGVTVDLDLWPADIPVKGDSVQLQQVMMNLMLNAFAAMRESEPDARCLVLRTTPLDASNVLIEVCDTGTGVAPETLESIFQPFITGRPGGLGMGLSICRSIIERHGGKIWAANNPGGGANLVHRAARRPHTTRIASGEGHRGEGVGPRAPAEGIVGGDFVQVDAGHWGGIDVAGGAGGQHRDHLPGYSVPFGDPNRRFAAAVECPVEMDGRADLRAGQIAGCRRRGGGEGDGGGIIIRPGRRWR